MNRTNDIVNAKQIGSRLVIVALAAFLSLGVALRARAQGAEVDPPSRVARLSDVSGQVWLFAPETNEWVGVDRNRPLTTGDRIATDNGARAEITLGSSRLRLDAATELEIVQLDDRRYLVHLHSGSVAARLRNAQSVAEFALETDEGRFRAQTVGRYRFDRFEQASDLTVYNGQAIFEGRDSALPLTTGQHAQFWLDAGGAPQYNMVEPARDAFAASNDERDRAIDRPVAVRYVSPEMTGAEDLDRYGAWEQTPDYGPIWTPRETPAGWAPYSAGHWAWVRPWGWTWVDEAPWGFAPFHYGRWVYHRDVWGWAPGTYVARPVYAPALVAWMGGPRVSVSINIGGGGPPVGWFPLAPHEVYVPSYRTSPQYVREVNITHVTNITNITNIVNNTNGSADRREFANRSIPNAVTIVPASVLTSRQSVAPAAAQFRTNPQIRALVADPRPAPVMVAAPVATPPALAKPPEAKEVTRPPFEGRAPGLFAGRPAPGSLPGSPPVAGGPPRGTPPSGVAPGRPLTPVPTTGQPTATAPAPLVARPDAGRLGPVAPPSPAAVERPPMRGGVAREPGAEAQGLRPGMAPIPAQRAPQPVEPLRPNAVAPAAPTPPVGMAPPVEQRPRQGRPGSPEETRAPGRPPPVSPSPPVNVAPPIRPAEQPRAAEAPPRREPPPRAIEALRPSEAPHNVAPPPRAVESQRVTPALAVPPPPRQVEPVRQEPVRVAPEQKVVKPEPPRRDDKKDEKRDEKKDDKPNERQR